MKTTIRIEVVGEQVQREIVEIARDAFPEALSITVESEDGTSETVYTRKK